MRMEFIKFANVMQDSNFDDFLEEEGIKEHAETVAIKRIIVYLYHTIYPSLFTRGKKTKRFCKVKTSKLRQ